MKYQSSGKYPLRATEFHRCETVRRSHLVQHPVNVVLHGLFGKIQLARNLFVGKPTANHLYQLLLPARQAQIVLEVKIGSLGSLGG